MDVVVICKRCGDEWGILFGGWFVFVLRKWRRSEGEMSVGGKDKKGIGKDTNLTTEKRSLWGVGLCRGVNHMNIQYGNVKST